MERYFKDFKDELVDLAEEFHNTSCEYINCVDCAMNDYIKVSINGDEKIKVKLCLILQKLHQK